MDKTDPEITRIVYLTAKALQVAETPLLISEDLKLEQVSRTLAELLRADVLRASAARGGTLFIENVERPGYLLLHLDVPIKTDLKSLVFEYLDARDILGPVAPTQFRLHENHRLALFAYGTMLKLQPADVPRHLLEMCTVIRV